MAGAIVYHQGNISKKNFNLNDVFQALWISWVFHLKFRVGSRAQELPVWRAGGNWAAKPQAPSQTLRGCLLRQIESTMLRLIRSRGNNLTPTWDLSVNMHQIIQNRYFRSPDTGNQNSEKIYLQFEVFLDYRQDEDINSLFYNFTLHQPIIIARGPFRSTGDIMAKQMRSKQFNCFLLFPDS